MCKLSAITELFLKEFLRGYLFSYASYCIKLYYLFLFIQDSNSSDEYLKCCIVLQIQNVICPHKGSDT